MGPSVEEVLTICSIDSHAQYMEKSLFFFFLFFFLLLFFFFSRIKKALKLNRRYIASGGGVGGEGAQGLLCSNDDPRMTFDLLTVRSFASRTMKVLRLSWYRGSGTFVQMTVLG